MKVVEKIERMLIAAIAMASLFASAASACNCSHHEQPEIDETSSCHSHSHTEAIESASAKSLQSPCECVLIKPAPAVVAKSDTEISQPQSDTISVAADAPSFEQQLLAAEKSPIIERDRSAYHSRWLVALLPSRAPPRL